MNEATFLYIEAALLLNPTPQIILVPNKCLVEFEPYEFDEQFVNSGNNLCEPNWYSATFNNQICDAVFHNCKRKADYLVKIPRLFSSECSQYSCLVETHHTIQKVNMMYLVHLLYYFRHF